MADRTDIDALLIGALYGELTPADEARLTAHLASHPADRTALEDLTHIRDAVRAIGLHTVWLEPPQAVSARVLQEAARRVQPTESWVRRFVRALTAHPVLAAAMTIVIVVGVASTLYVRGADHDEASDKLERLRVSDHEVAMAVPQRAPAKAEPPAPAPPPPAVAAAAPSAPPPAASRAASGDLAGDTAHAAPAAEAKPEVLAFRDAAKAEKAPGKPAPQAKSKMRGITVEGGAALEPKDLDDARTAATAKRAKRDDSMGRMQAGAGPGLTAGYANPPAGVASGAGAGAPAEIAADKASDGTVIGWAQRQREQVIAYVRANNCRAAAAAAVEIYNRAPDFYASNIAIDREVKPCLPYVTSERERVDRARAAKRGNTETVSPSDPSPTAQPPVRN